MYKALTQFIDLQDGGYLYNAGDTFPRKGHKVSEARIKELSGIENKRRMALIEEVAALQKTEEVIKDDKPGSSDTVKSKSRKKK